MMTNVPLATINDEWSEFIDFKNDDKLKNKELEINSNDKKLAIDLKDEKLKETINLDNHIDEEEEFSAFEEQFKENDKSPKIKVESLEELVNTFDERIVNCFINYEEPVEIPAQVLNHEELLSECQMWWRLTNNLNQILPIDWKQTNAMKYLLPYLVGNSEDKSSIKSNNLDDNLDNESFDDELLTSFGYDYSACNLQTLDKQLESTYIDSYRALNQTLNSSFNKTTRSYLNDDDNLSINLDFHSSLIFCSNDDLDDGKQLLFTAEEVLKELDIILQEEDDDYLDDNKTTSATTTLEESVTNSNYYNTNYENDELDCAKFKDETVQSNYNKLIKNNLLLKPYGHPANSIGTSFSSNSLDEIISSGQLTRSQTSSSVEANSVYYPLPTKNQLKELEQEKQLFEQQLKTLNISELNEIYLDLETMIQNHSEILISDLANKDELEYEKELKNQFISLLICIQNKKRKQNLHKKKTPTPSTNDNSINKYLTTVIPYNSQLGCPDTKTLQILIKILKAINEDSPKVPELLTDFILKVLCPTT